MAEGRHLELVPPPKAGARRGRRLALRPWAELTLYDLLIPGLAALWVFWVTEEPWGPLGVFLGVLGVCLVKAKGGGPRG